MAWAAAVARFRTAKAAGPRGWGRHPRACLRSGDAAWGCITGVKHAGEGGGVQQYSPSLSREGRVVKARQMSPWDHPPRVIAKREALWRSRRADLDCRAPFGARNDEAPGVGFRPPGRKGLKISRAVRAIWRRHGSSETNIPWASRLCRALYHMFQTIMIVARNVAVIAIVLECPEA